MQRKKRKYTRKNKKNYLSYFKKILIIGTLLFSFHLLFINGQIIFSEIKKSDIVLITGDSQQNSQNISSDLQKHIYNSLEIFKKSIAKKILILGEINSLKIDEINMIKDFIVKQDIWGGNLAYHTSSIEDFPNNTKKFLHENDWNSMILSTPFGNYYKNKFKYSQKISAQNIEISYYYSGVIDSITGIFSNYYYWWKIQ